MKKVLALVAIVAVAGVGLAEEKADCLKEGDSVAAFYVKDVTGPAAGTELCYRCRFGDRPTVSIFAREVNDEISQMTKQWPQRFAGLATLPVQDVTSGYRAFTRKCLEAIELSTLRSQGPSLLQEMFFRAHKRGFAMKEVPIEFVDRTRGQSTLTFKILVQSLVFVPALRWRGW